MDVRDNDVYGRYVQANAEPLGRHGASSWCAAAGTRRWREARGRGTSSSSSRATGAALARFRDPAYQAAKAIRDPVVEADILIIEGYDGAQPSG